MKLFTRYSRINLTSTIVIFLLASIAFYYLINYIIIDQVDNDLTIEQTEILDYVKEHQHLPEPVTVKDQSILYTLLHQPYGKTAFKTVKLYDTAEKEEGAFRQLLFGIRVANNNYQVTVTKSLEEIDDLIHSILYISVTTILLILVASFIINRLILKRLWKPFYETLENFKLFTIHKKETIHYTPTQIDEFSFMNHILETTTTKAQQDYLLLKEFTENASHEMQTPLAIIRSKLDLLIQDESLSQSQGKALEGAYDAVQKLSRLNHSLLLLAKIENKQFEEAVTIDLKEKIEQKKEAFLDLWEGEHITIHTSLAPAFIKMNSELCDILLNNLFSNATKHNYQNGGIYIKLDSKQLIISNTGSSHSLDEGHLFSRFYKPVNSSENNGLGLSIIKQICDFSGFTICYQLRDNLHCFIVSW